MYAFPLTEKFTFLKRFYQTNPALTENRQLCLNQNFFMPSKIIFAGLFTFDNQLSLKLLKILLIQFQKALFHMSTNTVLFTKGFFDRVDSGLDRGRITWQIFTFHSYASVNVL